jgi:D-sedoheptulose 7-phosphate isomerase
LIQQTIADHTVTVSRFEESCSGTIEEMGREAVECLRNGGKICFFGNGGSAADAQHLATEVVVRYTRNRKGLPAISFTTDTSILTAAANDFGFDSVFARQVEALCSPGDIALGISTSGNSPNVVEALAFAREAGVKAWAFTGEGGGECAAHADRLLAVPSRVTARVQECHILAGHLICDLVEIAFEDTQSTISGR